MAEHNLQGSHAEERALQHLLARGLRLRERNFRTRAGEIDLIMQQGDALVFVEVRYRRSRDFGSAVETVTHPNSAACWRPPPITCSVTAWTLPAASMWSASAVRNKKRSSGSKMRFNYTDTLFTLR
jgi:hypothetical protein